MPENDNTIDTSLPSGWHVCSPLAGLGPETIKRIALQSRQLTTNESASIKKAFGDSINPNDLRIAFDAGATGTNLGGYVLGDHLPTVMFFSTNKNEVSEDILHEATHVWQNLTKDRYTGSGVPVPENTFGSKGPLARYLYDSKAAKAKPFTDFGIEQQPEMVSANEASARGFVQSHKAGRPFAGDMAFLDS